MVRRLQLFDDKDGIKFVLEALKHAIAPVGGVLVLPGQVHNRKTLANHCCGAVKQYLRAHTVLTIEQLHESGGGGDEQVTLMAYSCALYGECPAAVRERRLAWQDRRRKQQRTRRSGAGRPSAQLAGPSADYIAAATPRLTKAAAAAAAAASSSASSNRRSLLDMDLQKALDQLEASDMGLTALQAMHQWKPAFNLLKHDGMRLLMEVVQRASSSSWRYPDTAVYSLECLQVLLLLPSCQQVTSTGSHTCNIYGESLLHCNGLWPADERKRSADGGGHGARPAWR